MEVRRAALGVAAVADPPDQLTGHDPGAHGQAGGDSPTLTIVATRGVVVEVDVLGGPAVFVPDLQTAASAPDVADRAAGDRHHRGHLGGHDVGGVVIPAAAVRPETCRVAVLTDHRERELVVHDLPVLMFGAVEGRLVVGLRHRCRHREGGEECGNGSQASCHRAHGLRPSARFRCHGSFYGEAP